MNTTPPESDFARTERHLRALRRLADMGLELAEDLQQRILALDAADKAELVTIFTRLADEVRRTIAQEAKLFEAFSARDPRGAARLRPRLHGRGGPSAARAIPDLPEGAKRH